MNSMLLEQNTQLRYGWTNFPGSTQETNHRSVSVPVSVYHSCRRIVELYLWVSHRKQPCLSFLSLQLAQLWLWSTAYAVKAMEASIRPYFITSNESMLWFSVANGLTFMLLITMSESRISVWEHLLRGPIRTRGVRCWVVPPIWGGVNHRRLA